MFFDCVDNQSLIKKDRHVNLLDNAQRNVQRLGKFNVFAAEEPIGNAENYCDGKCL